MKRKRLLWGLIAAFGGVLLLAAAINPRSLAWAARWLDVGEPPQKADAVVLLNGTLNSRPFFAAALVHGGWAPKVVFSTVFSHPNQVRGEVPPFHEINLKVLEYGGVARDRVVLLDGQAETTFDEAQAVAGYLALHPLRKMMIVTEGPHTRRARWIFQRVLAGRPVEIVMVSAPSDEFDNENWWRSEEGFLYVVSEYFKLIFYGLRYGWLGYEMAGGAALLIILLAWFSRRRKLLHRGSPAL